MKFSRIFFILAISLVSSAQLPKLTWTPSVCVRVANVFDGKAYEKSLCAPKVKAPYYGASAFCKKHKMRLYDVGSSNASSYSIKRASKAILGGKKDAVVYVNGRSGRRCSLYLGSGKLTKVNCDKSLNFFCEFHKKVQPKISACEEIVHLTDFKGRYYRSACVITSQNFSSNAKADCRALNMKVLKVTNPIVRSSFKMQMKYKLCHCVYPKFCIGYAKIKGVFTSVCGGSRFSTCEFRPDSYPLPTSPKPDSCDIKQEMKSKFNKLQLCFVQKNATHNQAENFCQQNGMKLLDFWDFNALTRFLASKNISSVYVSNRTADGCYRFTKVDHSYKFKVGSCFDLLPSICFYK